MAVTGDFKKAFLQVRVGPEERDALIFHCLKNLDTKIFVVRFLDPKDRWRVFISDDRKYNVQS